MKLLMWHCSFLESRDIRRSNRPRGIGRLLARPVRTRYKNVLAAFVCVEEEDDVTTVDAAKLEITRLSDQFKQRDVVIVPFAHLSSRLMRDSAQARELIIVLADELAGAGLTVQTNSFGFHKEFELHYKAKGHPGSVAFREIPRRPREERG
jgi:threonyl-tRNA synthetase